VEFEDIAEKLGLDKPAAGAARPSSITTTMGFLDIVITGAHGG